MKEVSDGEMVQQHKYMNKDERPPGAMSLAASAHNRFGSLFGDSGNVGGGFFDKPVSSRKSSLAYPSEGELDHYISEGLQSMFFL